MQEEFSPPAAVRALNLVDAVWPAEEQPQPEVHLSPFHCHHLLSSYLRLGDNSKQDMDVSQLSA